MSLSVGARFGPYAIVSQLGSGGMGVVYEATDPRLKTHSGRHNRFWCRWAVAQRTVGPHRVVLPLYSRRQRSIKRLCVLWRSMAPYAMVGLPFCASSAFAPCGAETLPRTERGQPLHAIYSVTAKIGEAGMGEGIHRTGASVIASCLRLP